MHVMIAFKCLGSAELWGASDSQKIQNENVLAHIGTRNDNLEIYTHVEKVNICLTQKKSFMGL